MPASAPSPRARSSFSSLPAAASTRAPRSLAIWTPATPRPLPAAMTRTVSPDCTRASVTRSCQATAYESGRHAASSNGSAAGSGTALAAGTRTRSAYPPCRCTPTTFRLRHAFSAPRRHSGQAPHGRSGLTATRSPTPRPDAPPAPVLDLFALGVLGPVVFRAVEAQLAVHGVHLVGLEPGRQDLVVEAPGGVARGLDQLPRRERAGRLRLDERIGQARLLGALVEEPGELLGGRIVRHRRGGLGGGGGGGGSRPPRGGEGGPRGGQGGRAARRVGG